LANKFQCHYYSLAVPSLHPLNQFILTGNKAWFSCSSETPTSWGFHGRIFPSNVKIDGALLVIDNVQKKNIGIYNCTTKDSGGREYNLRGSLHVISQKNNGEFLVVNKYMTLDNIY